MKTSLLMTAIAVCFFIGGCGSQENIGKAKKEIAQQVQNFSAVSAEEFKKMKQTGKYRIIDIRSEHELQKEGWIPGYQKIKYQSNDFINKLENLDKDKKYLIYCNRGNRTTKVLRIMKKMGFKEAYHLGGGIQERTRKSYKIKTSK